jgi:hypothetical protein
MLAVPAVVLLADVPKAPVAAAVAVVARLAAAAAVVAVVVPPLAHSPVFRGHPHQ